MKRLWRRSLAIALVGVSVGAARSAPIEDQDAQQLLRLARLEQALVANPQLVELLCVDEAMTQRLLPPNRTAAAQRLEDMARRALEQCRLLSASGPEDPRLVAQLRATFVARVTQLEPLRIALEQCRRPKQRGTGAQECIARVLGRPASTEEVAAFSQEVL